MLRQCSTSCSPCVASFREGESEPHRAELRGGGGEADTCDGSAEERRRPKLTECEEEGHEPRSEGKSSGPRRRAASTQTVQSEGRSHQRATAHWEPKIVGDTKLGQTPNGSWKPGDALELPTTLRAGIVVRASGMRGQWTLLGATPLGGTDQVLVAALRIDER